MDDQVDRLCGLLAEETRLCGELAETLRAEQQAVIGLQPEAILVCLGRRETLQQTLQRLAEERRAVVRDATARLGAETAQAVELLPLLPIEPQRRVRAELRRLRGALLETRSLERQTTLLVGASLEGVNEILAAVRALAPSARYGADATLAPPTLRDVVDRTA